MFRHYKSSLLTLVVLLLPALHAQASTVSLLMGTNVDLFNRKVGQDTDSGNAAFGGGTFSYDEYFINTTPDNTPASLGSFVIAPPVQQGANLAGLELRKNGIAVSSYLSTVGNSSVAYLSSLIDGVSDYSVRVYGDAGTDYNLNIGVSAVPLPAAAWLFLSALGGLGWLGRRKQTRLRA